jgi:hypothetical protein
MNWKGGRGDSLKSWLSQGWKTERQVQKLAEKRFARKQREATQ